MASSLNAVESSDAGVGVEKCREGHFLQPSVAQSGRCEGCSRWIFGKEKVMWCGCCACTYCSACAPQARGNIKDYLWEDLLNTMGRALRDAERVKGQLANEIVSIDLEGIRSSFICRPPQTLSAEQIVVEHVFEQAKSAMSCASCAQPCTSESSDLHSKEEVVYHSKLQYMVRCASDEQLDIDLTESLLELLSTTEENQDIDEGSGAVSDLLDRSSEPCVASEGHAYESPPSFKRHVDTAPVQDGSKHTVYLANLAGKKTPAIMTSEEEALSEVLQDRSHDLLGIANLTAEKTPAIMTSEEEAVPKVVQDGITDLLDITDVPTEQTPARATSEANAATNVTKNRSKDLADITNLPAKINPTNTTPKAIMVTGLTTAGASRLGDLPVIINLDILDLPTDKMDTNDLEDLLDITDLPAEHSTVSTTWM
mmetsp:Transcript_62125/g.117759  ORF Transcript_62125/g.117759 Transcript_62125/m.117759 type:complete len:426 (+) Transcript_62125:62-1339(+)